ncbi:alpha/beta fold hydrolase, partial [Aeromonas caviae]|uniref:alpha/beta fold hydrolase n=1 Tax=Aeromonas caviae TaxID=648 RepID=UPI002B24769C
MLYHKTFELGPDRDWVVFVHGAGGSSSIWFKQLRAYREHFNVLLLDLRGHGQSNQLQQVVKGHYSFRAVTEDILRLLDHLRIPHAHFVGSSRDPGKVEVDRQGAGKLVVSKHTTTITLLSPCIILILPPS